MPFDCAKIQQNRYSHKLNSNFWGFAHLRASACHRAPRGCKPRSARDRMPAQCSNPAKHASNCYCEASHSLGVRPVMALNTLKKEVSLAKPDSIDTVVNLASGWLSIIRRSCLRHAAAWRTAVRSAHRRSSHPRQEPQIIKVTFSSSKSFKK